MRTWRLLQTWNNVKGFCFDSAKVCPVTFRPTRISWYQRKHNRCVGVCGRERSSCFSSPQVNDSRREHVCGLVRVSRGAAGRYSGGGSRRSGACRRTPGVAWEQFPSEHPEIGLTGASEHCRSESDCSGNFHYLICFPSPSVCLKLVSRSFGWILTIGMFLY